MTRVVCASEFEVLNPIGFDFDMVWLIDVVGDDVLLFLIKFVGRL